MSTHAQIATKNDDETYSAIYCHFDGYLDHCGAMLQQYYKTKEKVQELIDLGDLSSIAETIETCKFFARDNKEKDVSAKKYSNLFFLDYENNNFKYIYVFENNQWYCLWNKELVSF